MRTSISNVMYTNAVYFPNQKIYSGFTPGLMNYSCINHVYYAFANVLADGSIFVSRIPDLAELSACCLFVLYLLGET